MFGPKVENKVAQAIAKIWHIWNIIQQQSQLTFVTVPLPRCQQTKVALKETLKS
jgi:hypothetical protein